jgi:hypothetical protein
MCMLYLSCENVLLFDQPIWFNFMKCNSFYCTILFIKVPAATTAVAAPQTSVAPAVPSVVSGPPGAVSPPVPPLPIQVCILKVRSYVAC